MNDTSQSQWLKRIFIWTGLFGAGILVGIGYVWLGGGWLQRHQARQGATITLTATIDGSDRFVFTPGSATNRHAAWGSPRNVFFNDAPWPDLSKSPLGWVEMSRKLNLARAALLTREGRDVISLEHTAAGFEVVFADTQIGAGSYKVTILIPRK